MDHATGRPADALGRRRLTTAEWLVFGLPSVVMGLVPLLMTRRCAGALGLSRDRSTLRALRLIGLRELVVALVFLWRRDRRWLWGFVAQDAVDLPLCGWRWRRTAHPTRRFRRACRGYGMIALVDLTAALVHAGPGRGGLSRPGPARRSRR